MDFRRLLGLMILITIPYIAFSQSVKKVEGIVKDADTGEPLLGVTVFVKQLNKGTTTNEDGCFYLKLPKGKHSVSFSYIGYESNTQRINVTDGTKKLKVRLMESVKQLSDVTVTAKSEIRELREQAMPISVISMNDIKGTVSDIHDVLSRTAGVKIRTSGGEGSASRISVRGLEGKRIGFFIDGTPMNDNSDFIDINDIPVDMIDRIEIYKGIVPAKFGGSSIGGAVNIVLKEYPPQYIDLGYSIESFNTHKANAIFKRNIAEKGYEYGIGGWYTHADNNYKMELPLQPGRYVKRDHDKFDKKVIGAGFTSKSWWFDEVVFEPAVIFTEKEIQGIEYNIQEAKNKTEAYVLSNHIEKSNFLKQGLDMEISNIYGYSVFRFQDKAMNRYNWDGTLRPAVTKLGGEVGTTPNDAYNQKHSFIQKFNLNYILSKHHSLNFNSVYNYAKGIPEDKLKDEVIGYKTNYESKMNSWVAGLAHEYHTLDNKFTNSLSLKYYYYSMKTTLVSLYGTGDKEPVDMQKNNWGINNALRYRFTPSLLAKASLAYDVRLPAENELIGDGFLIVPAGNLEPERNTSVNLGFMYDHTNSNGKRLQVELNTFYMYLENMIRFTGGPLQSVYQNFGKMRTLGIEGEVKWDATRFLYLYANATYQDLRDVREHEPNSSVANPTKGDRMPNIPYFFFNTGFELHKENFFGGRGQNSRLFSELSFVEEYFYDFEQSDYQERRIPRATTLNLGIEHSFKNGNVTLGIQGNNITDAKVLSEFNRPMPGRNFSLKLRYIWR
ncbi:TonB-dependent receptor [Prolixibacteraceae bacterium JC049]|nr:TonB-dependent receptor [Prolixibacteraceae bacterium JC049]